MNIAVILALTTLFASSYANRFVCYYGSWSVYRHGPGKFTVEDIDPTLCTHLIYAFVGLNHNGHVILLDPYNDVGDAWKEGAFTKLQRLRKINPGLKIMCSIGGWNEGSEKYSRVVNDPKLRKLFAQSLLDTTLKYNFDGFDIDWEYPAQRGGSPKDRESYSELLRELSELFKPRGLLLGAAVTANTLTAPASYDCKALAKYLDFINVMTYDLRGGWDRVTGHHTALFPHPTDNAQEQHLNVDNALKYWIKCTGAPEKINVGLAAYGRTFTLSDPKYHGVGAPAVGPGPPGSYVGEPGFLGFNELCREMTLGLWEIHRIVEQEVKYAVKGRIWIGYDDVESITRKINHAKSLNVGGAMIWSIETDDFKGECGLGKNPLLRAVKNLMDDHGGPTSTYPTPTYSTPTTKDPLETTFHTTSVTTPTPPPPSTSPPDNAEEYNKLCDYPGHIFKHPRDPTSFFICTYSGDGFKLKAVQMHCPDKLVFDEISKVCMYPPPPRRLRLR